MGRLPDKIAEDRKSAQKPALDDAQGCQRSCLLSPPCFWMLLHRLLLHTAWPGLRYWRLQHCPLECASRGICLMRLSRITTTSSKLGRLSGLGSQHRVTIFFSVCTRQCQCRSHSASPCSIALKYFSQNATHIVWIQMSPKLLTSCMCIVARALDVIAARIARHCSECSSTATCPC